MPVLFFQVTLDLMRVYVVFGCRCVLSAKRMRANLSPSLRAGRGSVAEFLTLLGADG